MSRQAQWQLDGAAPEVYQRYLVPAVTALWAVDLVERVSLQRGARVLDVACGTGVVARVASERVGGAGQVAALDLNPGMLAVARALPTAGAAIAWYEGSVLALPFPEAAFDVVFCQLGLQFFPDRPAALREMRRVLITNGQLALNVFGPIEHNPATHALANALDHHLGGNASLTKHTEHALADPEEMYTLLLGVGFQNIVIQTVRKLVRFPSPSDYVQIQLTATPLATIIAQYDPLEKQRLVGCVIAEVSTALAPYCGEDGLVFPQEVHIALCTS